MVQKIQYDGVENSMMENGERFKINEPNVVHENIDGETVVLNLDTGNYYSLVGVGAEIWEFILKGMTGAEILGMIRQSYEFPSGDEENAVHSFLEELRQEGLIVAHDGDEAAGVQEAFLAEKKPGGAKAAFHPPVLNKYTDMQDLLVLDPIHEVDATGWPSTKVEK